MKTFLLLLSLGACLGCANSTSARGGDEETKEAPAGGARFTSVEHAQIASSLSRAWDAINAGEVSGVITSEKPGGTRSNSSLPFPAFGSRGLPVVSVVEGNWSKFSIFYSCSSDEEARYVAEVFTKDIESIAGEKLAWDPEFKVNRLVAKSVKVETSLSLDDIKCFSIELSNTSHGAPSFP